MNVTIDHAERRPASSALLLATLAEDMGLNPGDVLGNLSARLAGSDRASAEITAGDELAIIERLAAAVGPDSTAGLEAGLRYRITTYGIWGYALVSAPTLRSAIEVGVQFADLTYAFCRFRTEEDPDEFRIVLEEPALPTRVRRFVVQRDAAAIQAIQRDISGGRAFLPVRVEFRHELGDASPQPYEDVFGARPTFGAPENVLAYSPTLMDAPLPLADERTWAMAREQCQQLLTARHARSGTAGQVRELILHALPDVPTSATVCADMHLSDRSLRRHLASEGTTLRALVGEVRATLAAELLSTTDLSVTETARRLGYAEVSSFSEAFVRWYGVSPTDFRARQ